MSEKTLKVIEGIAQAAADSYDGALDEKGEAIKIGLKREEGNPLIDSRAMDGFKVRCSGTNLICTYQSQIKLRDVYATKFEDELEHTMANIVKHLKKRYKQITGSSLGLKSAGDVNALVQKLNNNLVFVVATKVYKISGMDAEDKLQPSGENLEKDFKSFLELGGWGKKSAKPKNVTRRAE